jgi:hypothetical protein
MHDPSALDSPLLERTDPVLARPLPAALEHARDDVLAAAHDLLAIPEAAMARPWVWIAGGEDEVRYGAYRSVEALEEAEAEARAIVAPRDASETRAARLVGSATASRWEVHGLLMSMPEALLDLDPGDDEWTIRLTVGHIISGQRGYSWGTAWWLEQAYPAGDPDLPPGVSDEVFDTFPGDATEGEGSRSEIMARLDATMDLSTERLAGLPDDRLLLGARWSGFPITIAFRFGRWSSHIREHTVQIEKTLAILGHTPTEPARLTRLLLATYGRTEATVFGRQAGETTAAAAERIAQAAAEARDSVHAARVAAGS